MGDIYKAIATAFQKLNQNNFKFEAFHVHFGAPSVTSFKPNSD